MSGGGGVTPMQTDATTRRTVEGGGASKAAAAQEALHFLASDLGRTWKFEGTPHLFRRTPACFRGYVDGAGDRRANEHVKSAPINEIPTFELYLPVANLAFLASMKCLYSMRFFCTAFWNSVCRTASRHSRGRASAHGRIFDAAAEAPEAALERSLSVKQRGEVFYDASCSPACS